MNSPRVTQLVPMERVEKLIHLARGEKVLLDADLAKLYGVETRALNQAVRRNLSRFPPDFMFRLAREEADILFRSRSQSVILNKRGKNIKYLPCAFTEQGVAMLSSVLRSERAVQVNVAIMRALEMSDSAFAHDVFLSHGAKDKAVGRQLAQPLQADGLKV